MNETKKILMIGPFPEPITGMSLANEMIFKGLNKNGHKVDFVDTDTDKTLTTLKSQGKFNFKKVLRSLKPIIKGCSNIILKKYDVIYITPAQSYLGFLKYVPFIRMANLKGTNCYIHFHGGFVKSMYESINYSQRMRIKRYFNMCDGVIVLGDSLKSMLEGIVPDKKVFVCENGIEKEFLLDEKSFENKLSSYHEEQMINILFLSNLMKTKGVIDLLQAFEKIRAMGINAKLHLAGAIEADIDKDINFMIKEFDKDVQYHGVVRGEEKAKILEQAQIFCLPTYYPNEGQPISILEAMGSGTAIITTNQGGITDIFEDDVNGVLCSKNNSDSIVDSTIKAINNYKKYALNNYNICKENYIEDKFVSRLENIILN